jgi:hypothetical protein
VNKFERHEPIEANACIEKEFSNVMDDIPIEKATEQKEVKFDTDHSRRIIKKNPSRHNKI